MAAAAPAATTTVPEARLLLIGTDSVGKSCVLHHLVKGTAPKVAFAATIGVEFENYLLEKDSSPLMHLEIWDTSGLVETMTVVQKFFTRADGAMLVFDLRSAKSFEEIKFWAKELGATGRDGVAMVVCGNKCDLVEEDPGKREVESDLAIAYADKIGAGYFEVSALTGANVREAFVRLAEDVLRRRRARASDEPPAPAEPVEKGAKPGGGNCCCS